ncbi:N-acetyltransferase family protein [Streptomyces sp. MS19]|uniref:GNAT family N-acetyltransferase n=1 Tax=Streptomyces sp. MS19 TaxID=3385972 RepID=UPI00399F0AD1
MEAIAELRATVLRADLERLGRYDGHRVRQRLRDAFDPRHTSVVAVGRELAGCVTVRPADDGRRWLENFSLAPRHQGRGIGTAVLRGVPARADADGVRVVLYVLRGSAARRLHERHGFVPEAEEPVGDVMARPVHQPSQAPQAPQSR